MPTPLRHPASRSTTPSIERDAIDIEARFQGGDKFIFLHVAHLSPRGYARHLLLSPVHANLHRCRRPRKRSTQNSRWWLWVPAFAGTTTERAADAFSHRTDPLKLRRARTRFLSSYLHGAAARRLALLALLAAVARRMGADVPLARPGADRRRHRRHVCARGARGRAAAALVGRRARSGGRFHHLCVRAGLCDRGQRPDAAGARRCRPGS